MLRIKIMAYLNKTKKQQKKSKSKETNKIKMDKKR